MCRDVTAAESCRREISRTAGPADTRSVFSDLFNSYICPECLSDFFYIQKPYCRKCGKQLLGSGTPESRQKGPAGTQGLLCRDCAAKERSFRECRCLAVYDDVMQEILTNIKYRGRKEYTQLMGLLAAWRLGPWIAAVRPDAFVPVPVHPERKQVRGYNQAELLAEELSQALYYTGGSGNGKIPVRTDLLIRAKKTTAQKELNADQRLMNLQGAFAVTGKITGHPRLMIIDDIYTTGSTLNACSEVLLRAGAAEIYGLCMAAGTDS
ncbi:MAG: ComF family protein [Lachnospiraceae bacterium]|nr:ComF family protein [Lachnospiraceae bacterium]